MIAFASGLGDHESYAAMAPSGPPGSAGPGTADGGEGAEPRPAKHQVITDLGH